MQLAQVFCRARGKSRCKEGLARVFAVQAQSLFEHYECCDTKFERSREFIFGYKVGGGHWRSVAPCPAEAKRKRGYKIATEPEISHGKEF